MGEALVVFFGFIGMVLLYLLMTVISIGVFVGAVWIVFKIFGIDIEGFTAALTV